MTYAAPPSIGRIVHYTLNASDVASLDAQLKKLADAGVHAGANPVSEGSVLPAVVVAVFDPTNEYGTANLQVLVDGWGVGNFWATSRYRSKSGEPEPGTWHWPPRV